MQNFLFTSLILFSCIAYAQGPDPYRFFPSAVGNVWEWSDGLRVKFIRDSIGQDSSKYLWVTSYSPPLYKIDTNFNVFWDPIGGEVGPPSNFLTYKLNADSGVSWVVDMHISESDTSYKMAQVRSKYTSSIFGHSTVMMEISYFLYQQDTVINENSWLTNINTLSLGFGETMYVGDYGQTRVLRGCVIDGDTMGIVTAVEEEYYKLLHEKMVLYQNYPNPFNPETKINYSIPQPGNVQLKIFNILGSELATLVNEYKPAGSYETEFDAAALGGLPSGDYIYTIRVNDFVTSKKMTLLK